MNQTADAAVADKTRLAGMGFTGGDEISDDLRRMWAQHDIVPLWESVNGVMRQGPFENTRIWRWEEMRPIVMETAKITSPSIIERRVLQLVNRSIPSPDAESTTGLMSGSLQALMPGEVARPHRHTMNALRFILEGSGAETVVDGKPCRMEVGDLVTTPAMTWHQHHNHGQPTVWLDVLDVYLHRVTGCAVFQPGPVTEAMPAFSDSYFAAPNITPVLPGAERLPHSPVFRYPWGDVVSALATAPARDDGSKEVRYVNPVTGGACMALIDCTVIELAPGEKTRPFRSSASAICSVVEGDGMSSVHDETIDWAPKDTFILPQKAWVSHQAGAAGARIFIASNREVFRRLGLLTEEYQH